jgi:hypothetical protein
MFIICHIRAPISSHGPERALREFNSCFNLVFYVSLYLANFGVPFFLQKFGSCKGDLRPLKVDT